MLYKQSHCKVNLLLNVLGRRADGFHELESVMQPVSLFDELTFERTDSGIQLSCSDQNLAVDRTNLVFQAAEKFLATAGDSGGVRIHLEKRIPMAAGLGGGSGNAGATLVALNEMYDNVLSAEQLVKIASSLGSDVPFFLQKGPALALGRGETIEPLEPFPALTNKALLLIRPGFGISTPWAYGNLGRFGHALNGRPGRAKELVMQLNNPGVELSDFRLYNTLEAPAFEKFPVLQLYKEFLCSNGAAGLMSGSGSTTFAVCESMAAAADIAERFKAQFGENCWIAIVGLN